MSDDQQPWVEWHLVKYQPSVRRGETVNIGLVAFDTTRPGAAELRFLEGDLRPATGSDDNYDRWVAFFRRAMGKGEIRQVVERWSTRATSSNFFVGTPGHSLRRDGESFDDIIDRLFGELVLPVPATAGE